MAKLLLFYIKWSGIGQFAGEGNGGRMGLLKWYQLSRPRLAQNKVEKGKMGEKM